LGGGLGTITKGLSWGSNIVANTVGSAGIGAGVTAAKNEITGSCDDVWESAKRSAFYGGLGAATGNSIASLGKGLSTFQARQMWMNSTLFAASNAIHRPNKPPIWTTIGVTSGNVAGNVVANYPGEL
jgi:hypothetical protein